MSQGVENLLSFVLTAVSTDCLVNWSIGKWTMQNSKASCSSLRKHFTIFQYWRSMSVWVPPLWHLQVILVCFCQISPTFNPSASVKQPPWCVTPDTSLGGTETLFQKGTVEKKDTVENYTVEKNQVRHEHASKKTQWRKIFQNGSSPCSIHSCPSTTAQINSQRILFTSKLNLCHLTNNLTFHIIFVGHLMLFNVSAIYLQRNQNKLQTKGSRLRSLLLIQ